MGVVEVTEEQAHELLVLTGLQTGIEVGIFVALLVCMSMLITLVMRRR